ncbi:replication initiation protein (plasmid) [Acinetobacter bereziniae]|uniref:Replication initiation protein n=4 Tax=Acinetobacter TaxID=469 RepID=A0A3F3MS35_ACIBA|nr:MULTISPECIES: replication initiation protein [Bacteria]EBL5619748.1 replication initiation protein [Salmonella enterica subsp. enterica serovar Agona]WEI24900.1 replication initiation protein [Acinetobacter bereziniae]MCU4422603.1 replication initiation protein [Acinetobacter lwoffii]PZM18815.1 replication initiation protein [Acinetobacter baumannii]QKU23286.1 replication initiation protein [Acinetobacter lwoffii]
MEENKKTYPPSWVVMQNNIHECFKSMNIDEKRMLILASPIARTTDATEKDRIMITAEEFARECGIKTHSAYTQLELASKNLIKRNFSYNNERGKKVLSNWVIDCTYEDGGIAIRFPEIVLLMLKEFDKLNPYTKYKKDIVLKLKKDYSFDLYHLAKKHQNMGQFEMSLDQIKNELGLPESYQDLSNLKKRVINPSIEEITANTDIDITYENAKQGRSVVGFKFIVKEKPKPKLIAPQRDQRTIDMFCNLSDAQINKYSTILSKLSELSDLSNFPDYPTFALWISGILRDPKSVREEITKRIFKALHSKTDFKP